MQRSRFREFLRPNSTEWNHQMAQPIHAADALSQLLLTALQVVQVIFLWIHDWIPLISPEAYLAGAKLNLTVAYH